MKSAHPKAPRLRFTRIIALAALALGALTAGSVAAQPSPPTTHKLSKGDTANYDAAIVLFRAGDYAGALLKFQAVYDSSREAPLLWNMAACAKNLRRYVTATRMLEQYLASPVVSEDDKAQARALIKTMAAFVSELQVDGGPPGASVSVDGVVVGKTPVAERMVVDLGEHSVRVEASGWAPFEAKIVARGGDRVVVTAKLERVVRRGRLTVVTDPEASIRIDGRVVGVGHWEGAVEEGAHHVELSEPGKRPYLADVVVHDRESRSLEAHLDAGAKRANLTWLWITGGIVLAGGLAVGGYFLFRQPDQTAAPLCDRANIPPYCVTVGR